MAIPQEATGSSIRSGYGGVYYDLMLALVLSAIFFFVTGYHFNYGNQNHYLLPVYKMVEPDFLPGDWLTHETFHHAYVFAYVLGIMARLLGVPLAALILQGISIYMIALSLLLVLKVLGPPDGWLQSVLFGITLLMVFCGNWFGYMSPGGIYLYSNYTQASTLAFSLWLLGIAFLFLNRSILTGTFIGLSACISFSMFIISVLFVPALIIFTKEQDGQLLQSNTLRIRWKSYAKAALSLGIPFVLIALPPTAYFIYHTLGQSPGDDFSSRVFYRFRAPWHVNPRTWGPVAFYPMWATLFIGVACIVSGKSLKSGERNLLALLLYAWVVNTLAFGIVYVANSPKLAMLHVWRSAPLLFYFATLVLALQAERIVKFLACNAWEQIWPLALIPGFFLLHWQKEPRSVAFLIAASASYLAVLSVCRFGALNGVRDFVFKNYGVLVVICFVGMRAMFLSGTFNWRGDVSPDHAQPYAWIIENTPYDAMFIVPPDIDDFRIGARRSIVVDFKGFPFASRDAREWIRRLEDITGVRYNPENPPDFFVAYQQVAPSQVLLAAKRYGASYFVSETRFEARFDGMAGFSKVYSDSELTIFRLSTGASIRE